LASFEQDVKATSGHGSPAKKEVSESEEADSSEHFLAGKMRAFLREI
jgi:hypothetical protein